MIFHTTTHSWRSCLGFSSFNPQQILKSVDVKLQFVCVVQQCFTLYLDMCAEMLHREATTRKASFSPDDTFGETHTKFRICISLHLYIVFMLRCEGLQVPTAYSFVFGSKEASQCDVSVAFILVFCWNYGMILWGNSRVASILVFWILDQNQIKHNPL